MANVAGESRWMNEELRLYHRPSSSSSPASSCPARRDGANSIARRGGLAAAGRVGMLLPDVPRNTAAAAAPSPTKRWSPRSWRRRMCSSARRPQHRGALHPRLRQARSRSDAGCRGWRAASWSAAIAMTEPGAGSDLQAIKTTARARRGRLRHQRIKDVHHERHERRPRLPGGEDRPEGAGPARHLAGRRRRRRTCAVTRSGGRSKRSAARRRTPASFLRRCPGAGGELLGGARARASRR